MAPRHLRLASGDPSTDWEELFRSAHTVEVSTAAFDPDKAGVGSSGFLGDPTSSALFIPRTPTNDTTTPPLGRYFFRLAALLVPSGATAKIRGLRQYVSIAQEFSVTVGQDSWTSVLELPVTSPLWAFPDGNVSWHLRKISGPIDTRPPRVPTPTGTSSSLYAQDSALLVDDTFVGGIVNPTAYQPAGSGNPPGDGIWSLGTIRDMRYPWNQQGILHGSDFVVEGPCLVALFASVRQTDPATRPYIPNASLPVGAAFNALGPEDQFIYAFGDPPGQNTRYRHIAGSIMADIGPASRPGCKT